MLQRLLPVCAAGLVPLPLKINNSTVLNSAPSINLIHFASYHLPRNHTLEWLVVFLYLVVCMLFSCFHFLPKYATCKYSLKPYPVTAGVSRRDLIHIYWLPVISRLGLHPILIICCVADTVLDNGDTAPSKSDKLCAFTECTFQRGRPTVESKYTPLCGGNMHNKGNETEN